jgi:hypothetical protein
MQRLVACNYDIAVADSARKLSELVRKKMADDGWELLGGPFLGEADVYCQALVEYNVEEEEPSDN